MIKPNNPDRFVQLLVADDGIRFWLHPYHKMIKGGIDCVPGGGLVFFGEGGSIVNGGYFDFVCGELFFRYGKNDELVEFEEHAGDSIRGSELAGLTDEMMDLARELFLLYNGEMGSIGDRVISVIWNR